MQCKTVDILPLQGKNLYEGIDLDNRSIDGSRKAAAETVKARNGGLSDVQPSSKYELPQAWADFLSKFNRQWHWYAHLTFKEITHPESAEKLWDIWVHLMNREIYGSRYWKDKNKGVIWARATEFQRRGAVHFHALIGDVPDYVNRMRYRDIWFSRGGISRIESYVAHRGAEYYMSKSTYAWKRGEVDLSDTLKKEVDGTRISGIDLHKQFISDFTSGLHPKISSFVWS